MGDLQRQHLDAWHLLVEKLHQSLQAGGDLISDKNQPDLPFPQISSHLLPETVSKVLGLLFGAPTPDLPAS